MFLLTRIYRRYKEKELFSTNVKKGVPVGPSKPSRAVDRKLLFYLFQGGLMLIGWNLPGVSHHLISVKCSSYNLQHPSKVKSSPAGQYGAVHLLKHASCMPILTNGRLPSEVSQKSAPKAMAWKIVAINVTHAEVNVNHVPV